MSTAPNDRSQRQAKIAAAAPKESRLKPLLVTLVSVIAVVAVVGAVWMGARGDDTQNASAGRTYPAGATGEGGGIVVNADKVKPGAPTLDIYEDFQCPACKGAEDQLGPTIDKMSEAGEVKVVYHTKNFLDDQLNNDSSTRAALGAACAADAGKFEAYHDLVFKNQPQQEGTGFTDAQLQQFAEGAGIAGSALDTWKKCYSDEQYTGYVNNVEETSARAGVTATPTFHVNGTKFDLGQVTSVDDFRTKVLAAGGAAATPAPSGQ